MKLYMHPVSMTSRPVRLFIAESGIACRYPNVARWLGRMKELKSWAPINEHLYGFAASVKEQTFVAI